ncbi:MAG: hypothetical protein GDYSWBUE_000465 [Candidatus Fervidibacterota bacterium]
MPSHNGAPNPHATFRFREHIIGMLVVTFFLLLPFREALKGKSLFYGDIVLQFIPWREFASKSLASGYIPLWNQYAYCGMPFLANGQSALFYPFNWLAIFIPAHTLITLGAVIHTMLCGWLTYALLAYRGCSPIASSTGALAFGMSSFVIGHVQFPSLHYTISWLPMMLLAAEMLVRYKNASSSAMLALTLAISFLCGHAQAWMLCLALVIAWGCSRAVEAHNARGALHCALLMIASLLLTCALTGAQWLAQIELLQRSAHIRVPFEEATLLSVPPWQLPNLFIPNLFGHPARGFYWGVGNYWDVSIHIGATATALALYGALDKHSSRVKLMLIIAAALGCTLSLGRFMPLYSWLYEHVPLFSTMRAPARFSIWSTFAISVLSAYGVERLVGNMISSDVTELLAFRRWTMACAAILLMLFIGMLKLPPLWRAFEVLFKTSVKAAKLIIPPSEFGAAIRAAAATSSQAMFAAACFLIALSLSLALIIATHHFKCSGKGNTTRALQRAAFWTLPTVLALELFVAIDGINPFVKEMPTHNAMLQWTPLKHIDRNQERFSILQRDIERCWFAFISYTSYPPPVEMERQLKGLLRALVPNTHMLYDLLCAQGYDPLKPLSYLQWLRRHEADSDVLRWLAVHYLVKVTPTKWRSKEAIHEALVSDVKADVVSIDGALPRAFITTDPPNLLVTMFPNMPSKYERAMVISQPNPNVIICELPTSRTAGKIYHIILDSAWCGWRAFVDGREEIWSQCQTHPAARAVAIKLGARKVVWAYLPTAYLIGLHLSMFGVLMLAMLVMMGISVRR